MLLLIDAGNTRVKWGVPETTMPRPVPLSGVQWQTAGAVDHAQLAQLVDAWQGLAITRVLIANVAGPAMQERLRELLHCVFGSSLGIDWFASVQQLAGISNGYRHPAQLGVDRLACAIGAHALFPDQSLIVASCGTATTIDAVTAEGRFIGGMILPGIALMATALARNTAQLPQVEQVNDLPSPFADNTVDAIASGCVAAQVGAIERAVTALRATQGEVLCVLAGGAAGQLMTQLAVTCEKVDNLVLLGLYVVATQPDSSLTMFPSC